MAHLREGLRLAELGGELWGVSLARQAFQELGAEIQLSSGTIIFD